MLYILINNKQTFRIMFNCTLGARYTKKLCNFTIPIVIIYQYYPILYAFEPLPSIVFDNILSQTRKFVLPLINEQKCKLFNKPDELSSYHMFLNSFPHIFRFIQIKYLMIQSGCTYYGICAIKNGC